MKNKNLKRFFALAMALCLAFAMMTVASASNEATSSGGSATSNVTLSSTSDGSLDGDPAATAMSVTVHQQQLRRREGVQGGDHRPGWLEAGGLHHRYGQGEGGLRPLWLLPHYG